ncbi:MAG: thioredoxin domain-containing protein [Longimicrobiales bacterium]
MADMRRSWKLLVALAAGVILGVGIPRLAHDTAEASPVALGAVATIGGVEVTRDDLARAAPLEFQQLAQQEYDLTARHLDRAIQIRLVELEAAEQGILPTDLVKREVDDLVPPVSDEAITAFYEERGLEVQGTREQLADRIREYLVEEGRKKEYTRFLGDLRDKHRVESRLEPPRIDVASEGFPSKGPEGAPVTIVEFADFQCPYCLQFIETLKQIEYAYGDMVRVVYRHYPIENIHPEARRAAEASACAADQGKFWEMHDALFANQEELGSGKVLEIAQGVDLDASELVACLSSGTHADAVEADYQAARSVGVTGTPALFVNGRFLNGHQTFDVMASVIDDELRRAGVEYVREPFRTSVESEGFPAKGVETAPITVVEFADFQCPYCGQLSEVLDQLTDAYPNEIRLVYRHFPLPDLHPHAQKSAEASLCADKQGKFWEMHDALYADQDALDVASLKSVARSLGLDGDAFDQCLDASEFRDEVAADRAAGRIAGVRGTPALFINGRFISGIQRYGTLVEIIEDELSRIDR